MWSYNVFKGFVLVLILCFFFSNRQRTVDASPVNTDSNHALRNRNAGRFSSRALPQAQYTRIRQEPLTDFLGEVLVCLEKTVNRE